MRTEATELRINGRSEVVAKDSVLLEQRDTLIEVTTITIDRNEQGDTLKTSVVTDRLRARAMSDVRSKMEDVRVRVDTVYVTVRDSVAESRNYGAAETRSRASPFVLALRWIFWIIISLTVLIVIIKLFILK